MSHQSCGGASKTRTCFMARSAVLSWLPCFVIFGALVAWIPSTAATAEKRVALVVGNAAYARPGEGLLSPCNDAQAIAGVLRDQLGFEVIEACNLNQLDLNSRVEEFVARIRPQGVALFFYAGHGVDVGGQNYLLPVGHAARSQSDV